MSSLLVLLRISFRNLFGSFLNVVIGGIILVGTLLFVLGGSLLGSVDGAMSKSITGSIAGHIQVYNEKSKDDLGLFNNWGTPDLTPIADFAKIKPAILSVPNVKAVVPMGVSGASITYGNSVDQALEKLRNAVKTHAPAERIESLKSHVRQMLRVIQGDFDKLAAISTALAGDRGGADDLQKASSDAFWATFDRDPLGHLEFLENKIASLVPDADFIFLSYVGTDLDAFRASFDRMEIVDGQAVPTGRRGMLLSKYVYETQFKLKTAHRLDKIHEALVDEGKTIAKDPDLQQMIKQNRQQTREILLQLDPLSSRQAVAMLQEKLGTKETELPKLLASFFDATDASFADRYRFFYDRLAPMLELYRLKPGEYLTIKSFTKSGFIQASNVKVYGTFQFKGLEKSGMAGGISLMDLMTFRDLYGYATPERLAETRDLEKDAGATFVDRDQAEAALFGGSAGSSVTTAKEARIDDAKELGGVKRAATEEALASRAYTPDEIEKGLALNAAIILKDPSAIKRTMADLEAVSKRDGLGLKVVSWQTAAGMIGQFVFVAKLVLYFAVSIIFIVALVIINNAVMMATLQRIKEIGTMRAIGAQRAFVLGLVLVETMLLGVSFGGVGVLLGSGVVKWMGIKGIPAGNEFLYFFFSGPRLYVQFGVGSLVGAFIVIFIVTAISALYPAIVATRVSPVQAMQTED